VVVKREKKKHRQHDEAFLTSDGSLPRSVSSEESGDDEEDGEYKVTRKDMIRMDTDSEDDASSSDPEKSTAAEIKSELRELKVVLACLVLSCLVVSCRVVSCRVVSCLVLSCLVVLFLVLS
jgi:hypothetical protein